MSSPTPLAVALIAGCAAVTIGAMWATVGYFARRFLTQQTANHQDTQEAVRTLHKISEELPRLGFRISRLEVTALVGGALAAYYAWRQKPPGSM